MPFALEIEENIGKMVERIIYFCTHRQQDDNFLSVEKELHNYLSELGCVFLQLMLISFQEKFDYSTILNSGVYYQGDIGILNELYHIFLDKA